MGKRKNRNKSKRQQAARPQPVVLEDPPQQPEAVEEGEGIGEQMPKIAEGIEPTDDPKPSIAPRIDPESWKREQLSWRFGVTTQSLRINDYGWNKLDKPSKWFDLLNKMAHLEGMIWNQILFLGHVHEVKPKDCSRHFEQHIKKLNVEEEALLQLPFGNKHRLFGYRVGAVFYVIYYDHEHKVYDQRDKRKRKR